VCVRVSHACCGCSRRATHVERRAAVEAELVVDQLCGRSEPSAGCERASGVRTLYAASALMPLGGSEYLGIGSVLRR
jgi:hypothetical protein